jgi:hypothetical protein
MTEVQSRVRKAMRFYIITDDGAIRRVARLAFEGIITQHTPAPVPGLAGKRVRYAKLVVQLEQRKAVAVRSAYFGYLTFDNDGMFDPSEWDEACEATTDAWGSPTTRQRSSSNDAIARIANLRSAREYDWQPTDELRRMLFAKVTRNRRPSAPR